MQKIIWAIFSLLFLFLFLIYSNKSAALGSSCSARIKLYACQWNDIVTPDKASQTCNSQTQYGAGDNYIESEGCGSLQTTWYCHVACTCPAGFVFNKGNCDPDQTNENPNGENPSNCPNGSNPDGSCYPTLPDPDTCGEGEINQGTVNGHTVCQKTCSDPSQSYGVVNGVAGCYGGNPPSCPNGGSFGYVNHVAGCYGGGDSGSNTSSGNSGTGTSSGSGTGGGNDGSTTIPDGGSNGSTPSNGGGNSGDGNNSGGGGGGNNNSPGKLFSGSENCPETFVKDGGYCVKQGDCITGYHQVVVSSDPFFAMCVKNNLPISSAASSSPSSSSSSRSSSSVSSSSASGNNGGSNDSSGNNGGSNGSAPSGGDDQQGQCDPKAATYLDCLTGGAKAMPDHIQTDSGKNSVADINQDFKNRLNNSAVVRSFDRMKNVVQLGSTSCPEFSITLDYFNKVISTQIHCTIWSSIKSYLSLVMMGVWAFLAFRIFASA